MFKIKNLKQDGRRDVRQNYWMGVIVCFILAVFFGEYSLSSYALTAYTESKDEEISYTSTSSASAKLSTSDYLKALYTDEEFWEIDNGVAFSTSPIMMFLRLTDDEVIKIYENYGIASPYGTTEINAANLSRDELISLNQEITKAMEEDMPLVFSAFSLVTSLVSSQNTYTLQFAAGIKSLFNMSNAYYGMMILLAAVIGVLFSCFVGNPLKIGRCRFFVENASYKETRATRIIFLYQQGYFIKPALILAIRSVLMVLWSITIVGFPIAYYRYKMIPYILAENPTIGVRDAFRLSARLMKKNKFHVFMLDLSFIGWHIMTILTFGLLGIFYINSYTSTTQARLYLALRKNAIANGVEGSELLCDRYLDATELSAEEKINVYYDNERAKARHEEQKLQDIADKKLRAMEIEREREEKLAAMKYDIDIHQLPQQMQQIKENLTDLPKTVKEIKTYLNQDHPKAAEGKENEKEADD